MVSIMTAELDWISAVDKKPTAMLLEVDEVKLNNFFLMLFKDKVIKLLLSMSIEYMKSNIPPINSVKVMCITIKIYLKKG